ncbi:hypothetical protein [Actinomadura sp. 9N215]|uniref:hypothetical protein n=1 Tax=Actinomadura sp. 9N215 TaxID=3375150 RepID=UPI003789117E
MSIQVDVDVERALDELRRSFPAQCFWYGEYSGSLWALLPDRLVEAKTAAELARRVHDALGRPRVEVVRPPCPSGRRLDGTWAAPVVRREARRPGRRLGRLVAGCLRLTGMAAWSRRPVW